MASNDCRNAALPMRSRQTTFQEGRLRHASSAESDRLQGGMGVKSLQAVEKLTIRPGLIPGYAMHDPLFAEDSDEEEQEKQAAGGQWLPYHFFAFLWSLP